MVGAAGAAVLCVVEVVATGVGVEIVGSIGCLSSLKFSGCFTTLLAHCSGLILDILDITFLAL